MSINNRGLSKEFQSVVLMTWAQWNAMIFIMEHDSIINSKIVQILYSNTSNSISHLQKEESDVKTCEDYFSGIIQLCQISFICISLRCYLQICLMQAEKHSIKSWNPALAASAACSALFLEFEGRRQEIALFIFQKSLETAWRLLKKRGYVSNIKELFLFGLAMGIINYFYHYDDAAIKSTYLTIFRNFWEKD